MECRARHAEMLAVNAGAIRLICVQKKGRIGYMMLINSREMSLPSPAV